MLTLAQADGATVGVDVALSQDEFDPENTWPTFESGWHRQGEHSRLSSKSANRTRGSL